MKIIDTHNHLYFPGYLDSFNQVLASSRAVGVTTQILIGIDELSCQAALNLAATHQDFKVTLGLHPCDVDSLGQYLPEYHKYLGLNSDQRPIHKNLIDYVSWLDQLAIQHSGTVVGFGETGFDQFHRQSSVLLKKQTESFEAHLELCLKHHKTLIIHSRGACQETLDFLTDKAAPFKKIKFVWHCFSEDYSAAKTVIALGGYLGVGGVITYPKSIELREIIKNIPLDKIVTETDAPFLTPHQARKKNTKLNSPAFLAEIIATIAQEKKIPVDECGAQLHENAQSAFNLLTYQNQQKLLGKD